MNNNKPDNAGVIAPPPLIPLAALLLGLVLDWLLPLRLLSGLASVVPRVVVGAALVTGGLSLIVVAGHFFAKARTNITPWKPTCIW